MPERQQIRLNGPMINSRQKKCRPPRLLVFLGAKSTFSSVHRVLAGDGVDTRNSAQVKMGRTKILTRFFLRFPPNLLPYLTVFSKFKARNDEIYFEKNILKIGRNAIWDTQKPGFQKFPPSIIHNCEFEFDYARKCQVVSQRTKY